DLVSCLRYHRQGNLTFRQWIASFRGVEEAAFYASDDLYPCVTRAMALCGEALKQLRRRGALDRAPSAELRPQLFWRDLPFLIVTVPHTAVTEHLDAGIQALTRSAQERRAMGKRRRGFLLFRNVPSSVGIRNSHGGRIGTDLTRHSPKSPD